ncbi:DUF4357 domain-containing protein [Mycoplasma capricolum subsp. capricolum]|uniref:DUF4357 domain-containing protein n=1 Tax=Mycoplasma capricolum TaxID=2095 RepID=UPI003DA2F5F1
MSISTFHTYLLDSTDYIKYVNKSWTGVIYKISKNFINNEQVKNEVDLKSAGIYFLVKQDVTNKSVYIGQADVRNDNTGILTRVLAHFKEPKTKDFDYVYILTSTNNLLGATELKYLEYCFINRVDNKLISLKNENSGSKGNISLYDQKHWEDFLDNTITIFRSIGFDIFTRKINTKQESLNLLLDNKQTSKNSYFKMVKKDKHTKQILTAYCIKRDDKWVVLAGSQIRLNNSNFDYFKNMFKSIKEKRDDLTSKQKIINGILQQDQEFSSSSYASVFVLGRSSNGKQEWKPCNKIPDLSNLLLKSNSIDKEILYRICKNRRNDKNKKIIAHCKKTNENKFVVLKNSDIEMIEANHFKTKLLHIHNLRKECIKNKIIIDYKLLDDIEFKSLSSASSFVLGRSSNGNIDWERQ